MNFGCHWITACILKQGFACCSSPGMIAEVYLGQLMSIAHGSCDILTSEVIGVYFQCNQLKSNLSVLWGLNRAQSSLSVPWEKAACQDNKGHDSTAFGLARLLHIRGRGLCLVAYAFTQFGFACLRAQLWHQRWKFPSWFVIVNGFYLFFFCLHKGFRWLSIRHTWTARQNKSNIVCSGGEKKFSSRKFPFVFCTTRSNTYWWIAPMTIIYTARVHLKICSVSFDQA